MTRDRAPAPSKVAAAFQAAVRPGAGRFAEHAAETASVSPDSGRGLARHAAAMEAHAAALLSAGPAPERRASPEAIPPAWHAAAVDRELLRASVQSGGRLI